MITRTVNVSELYTYLAGNKPNRTGFISYEVVLADGRKIAGLYRGFGATFAVLRAPKAWEKGFRSLGPIESENIRVLD